MAAGNPASSTQADPRVNVSFSSKAGWVSLTGAVRVDEDRARLKELWDASAGISMSGGPEDASNVLRRVGGATAELWESPGKADDAWLRFTTPASWSLWAPLIRDVEASEPTLAPGTTGRVLGPTGTITHPGATLSVAVPEGLADALGHRP